jgi:hypothetical protein
MANAAATRLQQQYNERYAEHERAPFSMVADIASSVAAMAAASVATPARVLQLVLVVDATHFMRPHWPALQHAFLKPLLAFLQKAAAATPGGAFAVELALVTFRDAPPIGDYLVRSSKWTSSLSVVNQWLQRVDFRGGGCSGRAHVCAGLCAALQLGMTRHADQRCVVLVSNGIAKAASCGVCELGGELAAHADAYSRQRVCLSIVAPQDAPEWRQLFASADPLRSAALDGTRWIWQPTQINTNTSKGTTHVAHFRALPVPVAAGLTFPVLFQGQLWIRTGAINVTVKAERIDYYDHVSDLFQPPPARLEVTQVGSVDQEKVRTIVSSCTPLLIDIGDDDGKRAMRALLPAPTMMGAVELSGRRGFITMRGEIVYWLIPRPRPVAVAQTPSAATP